MLPEIWLLEFWQKLCCMLCALIIYPNMHTIKLISLNPVNKMLPKFFVIMRGLFPNFLVFFQLKKWTEHCEHWILRILVQELVTCTWCMADNILEWQIMLASASLPWLHKLPKFFEIVVSCTCDYLQANLYCCRCSIHWETPHVWNLGLFQADNYPAQWLVSLFYCHFTSRKALFFIL